MATTSNVGNSGFRYTPLAGGAEVTVRCRAFLRSPSPAKAKARWVRESLDRTVREVVTVADAVEEVDASIHHEDEPAVLLTMLDEGLDGAQLDYYTDLDTPGSAVEFQLLAVNGDAARAQLQRDSQTAVLHEYETGLRLRRTGGAALSTVL